MKTTLLAIVLAVAVAAAAQTQAQTQPAAPASGQATGPEIKDGAEYNAYGGNPTVRPQGQASALEAFLVQHPNSVMKSTALQLLMGTYLQINDQVKVVDSAKRLLIADPCDLRALALLSSWHDKA
jgi:hypothetical protein